MIQFKNLERLGNAIEKLNDLMEEDNNKINQTEANNIINEFNDIYIGLEDDLFSYTTKIEEMEEDLECIRNKSYFDYNVNEEF